MLLIEDPPSIEKVFQEQSGAGHTVRVFAMQFVVVISQSPTNGTFTDFEVMSEVGDGRQCQSSKAGISLNLELFPI